MPNCLVCKKNVELKFIAFCLSLIVAFSSCLQSSLEVHEQNFYFRCMHAGSFGKSSKSDWWGICNTLKIQSQKKLQQRSQHSLEFKQAYFRDHLNAIYVFAFTNVVKGHFKSSLVPLACGWMRNDSFCFAEFVELSLLSSY